MSRGTKAWLDLSALQHNLSVIHSLAPDCRVLAVVKANGYGHGLERMVETLSAGGGRRIVDAFAVATIDEALRVRRNCPKGRVLLLEGVTSADELALVAKHDFDMVVHCVPQLELLQAADPTHPYRVWLKVDTGMHRLGFPMEQAYDVWQTLSAMPQVTGPVILMSHLANADDLQDPFTDLQQGCFETLRQTLPVSESSLANSAAIAGWPNTHYDWVRPGLLLYGASPLRDRTSQQLDLQPVMTLKSTLIAINHCQTGDRIGYGGHFRCPEPMPIGVVAIGYGDGYPRHASNGTPVLVNGVRCPLVGKVSMDMLCVDLRPLRNVAIGDEAVLWGQGLPVEEIAHCADMIPYELLCGITSRVPTEVLN